MQQEIGKECGPFGPCIEHRCRHWRPVMLDEAHQDGSTTTREEWDCALDWPIFLHQTSIKRTRGVEAEIESFRKGVTEAKPHTPLGILALAFSSMAQSLAHTIEMKPEGRWRRFFQGNHLGGKP